MTTTAMVVMEPGSDWPGQIGDATTLVAFRQEGGDIVCKTQGKLDALQRNGQGVRVAVLACNPTTGDTSVGRRAQLARILLDAVTGAICGRLILTANGGASHQLRQELLTLAGRLTMDLHGKTATVCARFNGGAALPGRAVSRSRGSELLSDCEGPSPPAGEMELDGR